MSLGALTRAAVAAVLAVYAWPARGGDEAPPFDPVTGYRTAHYRAAVPQSVPGGTRIGLQEVDALIGLGAVLVDVMPSSGRGLDPKTGRWLLSHEHSSIPGATWLPDAGRGTISDELAGYFAGHLERLTSNDKARPLILFCQSDCWMAWNAVQRAAKLGYTQVYWFPEGTDGWVEWGDRKLVHVEPKPLERAQ